MLFTTEEEASSITFSAFTKMWMQSLGSRGLRTIKITTADVWHPGMHVCQAAFPQVMGQTCWLRADDMRTCAALTTQRHHYNLLAHCERRAKCVYVCVCVRQQHSHLPILGSTEKDSGGSAVHSLLNGLRGTTAQRLLKHSTPMFPTGIFKDADNTSWVPSADS